MTHAAEHDSARPTRMRFALAARACVLACALAARHGAAQQPPVDKMPAMPATGRDLLQAMRQAHSGRWFTTLTFTQQTTSTAADGKETIATWYESLRYSADRGTQLRIDTGEPAAGNGVLYSADSLWVFRAGKQVVARPGSNALLPLIEGVYVQPLPRTVAELEPTKVDLSRPVLPGSWNGRPVWIAGAASDGDVTSPQFWVDTTTKAVVRAIFSPVPGAPVMDMRLQKLVALGGGWLATRCEFFIDGKLSQVEEYENWKAGVDLPSSLFDPATWSTAPHWADKRANPPASPATEAFVQTIGRDTISLEQFTRSGNLVAGTWLTTYGGLTVHEYTLTLRPDGSVEHSTVSIRRVSGQQLGDIAVTYGRDSVTAVARGDSETTVRTDAPDAFPVFGQTAAMWETIFRHQRAARQDSGVVTVVQATGEQARRGAVVLRADSARFLAWQLAIDRDGSIVGGVSPWGPNTSRMLRRVSSVDIRAAEKSFPDIPSSVPLESASYARRDTVRATAGGATVTIDYNRPYAAGRRIFSHGILGDTLWRTGIYAATQLATSGGLLIDGKVLPAGKYTLWTYAARDNSSYRLVFNRQVGQWGTEHDGLQDLLSVPLSVASLGAPTDPFTIAIENDASGSRLVLRWATTELSTRIARP